jgi:hypothetical protein
MFDFVKAYVLIGVAMVFPPADKVILWIGKTFFSKMEEAHRGFVKDRLMKRLENKDPRPDLYLPIQANCLCKTDQTIQHHLRPVSP